MLEKSCVPICAAIFPADLRTTNRVVNRVILALRCPWCCLSNVGMRFLGVFWTKNREFLGSIFDHYMRTILRTCVFLGFR